MSGLIVYGSLMSIGESSEFGLTDAASWLVHVRGFRRELSQEPSWRVDSGEQRGILTVVTREGASFNAVLISEVRGEALRALDHRERGYDRVEVPAAQITPFGGSRLEFQREEVFMYVGKPQLYNASIKPNVEYLDLCLESAAAWGDDFADAFLDTTFVRGVVLRSFRDP